MLMPKRVKRRKQFRGTMAGKALRGNKISNGEFGIVAMEPAWIRSNQIEAARVAMTRYIKRGGKVWIKIFPDKPVTAKPAETRMGSGKGTLEYWVAVVKPGRVMFEIAGVPEETAREALRLAMHKLPVKCKIVSRADLEGGDNSENIRRSRLMETLAIDLWHGSSRGCENLLGDLRGGEDATVADEGVNGNAFVLGHHIHADLHRGECS